LKHLLIILFLIFTSQNLLSQNYEQVEDLYNGFLIYKKESKFAITKDSENLEFVYDSIYHPADFDFLIVEKNGKFGVRSLKNKEILPIENEAVKPTRYRGKGLGDFYVKRDSKIGTVNRKNKVILPIIYDDISVLNEGNPDAIYLNKDNKVGIANFYGKIIIPCVYDSIYYYKELEIIKVKKNGLVGLISQANKVILPVKHKNIIIDYDYLTKENLSFTICENDIWSTLDSKFTILQRNISWENIKEKYKFGQHQLTNYDFKYVTLCYMEKNRNYR